MPSRGVAVPESVAITRSGQITVTCSGYFLRLDRDLATTGAGPAIIQVNPFTAEAIAQIDVAVTWDDWGYPFAFWAGDFYTFPPVPADAGKVMQTNVVRLHPGATTRETVVTVDGVVGAASSSPCAPTQ